MHPRQLLTRRHRRGALVAAGLAIAATVSACSSSPQHGAPAQVQQARSTPQLAADTSGRSFQFKGMRFRLTGETQYDTNLPQCPKPKPVVRIPAGIVAQVEVVPNYAANCPAQSHIPTVVSQYPAGYLGEVALLSGYDNRSFYVVIAKPYAHPSPTLPAGSFEAEVPASAATFEPGLTSPAFLFWNSATNAILLITGPHSATLAQQVRSSLHEV